MHYSACGFEKTRVLMFGCHMENYDVIVIGAGAAGLMCAITAGKRGLKVLIVDHANKIGKKILLSGGGRCNFTNLYTTAENYLSQNKHFCISALARYTQYDFINLVEKHDIAYHEKTLGQLFCDVSAKEIVRMLLVELNALDVTIKLQTEITHICKNEQFILQTDNGGFVSNALVVATGGLSFPTMGATPFGYKVAEQFGLNVLPVRAGLVPLTLQKQDLELFARLAGVAVHVIVSAECGMAFRENILFTHRGLSGPAVLQISSYWHAGENIFLNFIADLDLLLLQQENPNLELKTILGLSLPQSLVKLFCEKYFINKLMKQYTKTELENIISILQNFPIKPNATEGYRTAEVTLGGVDTNEISSKTFVAKKVPGLYFIGEVLDVTGHLGGFNFQWAWASGYCCGMSL
jgi:predicted Rossmann fold flavoprotein